MSVQAYLENHHVFSLEEFRSELGDGRTPYNLLVRATKRGLADRVMRGVYVSRTGRFSREEPDPYLVAAAASSDAVMVYHSALELHGLAHSPSRRVQFVAAGLTPRFTYRDWEFRRYDLPKSPLPADTVQSTMLVPRPDGVVRVTTRERTLVDCVNRSDLAGGLEEVFRSLASLPYVDASNVLAYLRDLRSPTAVARTGWTLEQRAREWYVPDEALEEMRSMLGKGPYYLTRSNQAGTWAPTWRLYLPDNATDLERWVRE
ncbi:MAG: type IV toxin-antitoxin system AbiEi family antitoxin [Coriobacteriia bacterium]